MGLTLAYLTIVNRMSGEDCEQICLTWTISFTEHYVSPECSSNIKINLLNMRTGLTTKCPEISRFE